MIEIKKLDATVPYASNTYLVTSLNECAVIDPSAPYSEDILEGKILKYILLTHAHFDHFLEIDSWVSATGAEVIISKNDADALSDSYKNCYSIFLYQDKGYRGEAKAVKSGDTLTLGDEVIEIEEYPGHTVGSIVYTAGKSAFVGDVAFAGGGYGRCDLPGGNTRSMLSSLKKIITLDDDTVLYPGHGDSTTVSEYKKHLYI
jgi:glyoxylase-like metal-dependent hydrolase (beta-lactamase superfamily II)